MRFKNLSKIGDEYEITFLTTSEVECNKALANKELFAFTEEEIEVIKAPVSLNKVEIQDNEYDIADINLEYDKKNKQIFASVGDDEFTYSVSNEKDVETGVYRCLLALCGFSTDDILNYIDKIKEERKSK